ncbi:MAG: hypothetical protein JO288_10855 [Hyphomicrobiales bacterium]|nr:hypothetical protein [Hyphomicrobiales bacterium]
MLRYLAATALISLASSAAWGTSSPETDAQWDRYFSVWANEGTATPQAVEKFYANRVNYYGREMTLAEVYRDKLYLMRQWPARAYTVRPGTVQASCSENHDSCRVTLALDFLAANPDRRIGVQGTVTLSLLLANLAGQMKIEDENGVTVLRSSCMLSSSDWRQMSNWQCSNFHFPPLPSPQTEARQSNGFPRSGPRNASGHFAPRP